MGGSKKLSINTFDKLSKQPFKDVSTSIEKNRELTDAGSLLKKPMTDLEKTTEDAFSMENIFGGAKDASDAGIGGTTGIDASGTNDAGFAAETNKQRVIAKYGQEAFDVYGGDFAAVAAGIQNQDTEWARNYRKKSAVGKQSLLTGSERGVIN